MKENTAVNGAGDFAQGAEDKTEAEDIDANIPLEVEQAKEGGDD